MSNHSISNDGLAYFDAILNAFDDGHSNRHAHLGYWDHPESVSQVSRTDFETAQTRFNAVMIGLAELDGSERILDVACGLGGLIEQLDDAHSNLSLTGLNVDVRQLERCQTLTSAHGSAIRWLEGDALDLPFADSCFDVLFCVEAIFHFASRRRFLQEAARVLVPGGRIVLSDFQLRADAELPMFCIDALLSDGYGPWPDPWSDDGTIVDLLNGRPWQSIKTVDVTQHTLPSYQFILPSNCDFRKAPNDVAARAAMTLAWLQRKCWMEYVSVVAQKETA